MLYGAINLGELGFKRNEARQFCRQAAALRDGTTEHFIIGGRGMELHYRSPNLEKMQLLDSSFRMSAATWLQQRRGIVPTSDQENE